MRLLPIISFFTLLNFTVSAQGSETIDKIVAQVGDNVILLSDIQIQKLQALEAGLKLTPDLDCQILEELLYTNLLVNQAKLDSIEVTDEMVDSEMENRLRMIENQIGSRQKMEEFYGKTITQIKLEFKNSIRDQLLAQEMERQITGEIAVTPREVEKFFTSLPMDSIPLINAQLSFQQIVYYPEITKEDKERAKKHLAKIREDILAGKSFSTQARIHSMDPGSSDGGGEISARKGMMVPAFESTVFNLKVGEVSEIFETEYGYHIVKLLERKGDEYKCQHILIIPEFSDSAIENAALKIDSCYQLLKTGKISWDDAVIRYSNDEMTRQNKGIITNPITGEQTWDMEDLNQVDQQIYLLTDAMEKGDISEPNLYLNIYDRKQGIRIVRLMERTAPHRANLKDDYALIKSAAENDKKQRMVTEWTNIKIKNAYIRIDEEFRSCKFHNTWLN